MACPPPPGQRVARPCSQAASPRNTFPQEDLCPLGLQRDHVCFQCYTRLWEERQDTAMKAQVLTRRQETGSQHLRALEDRLLAHQKLGTNGKRTWRGKGHQNESASAVESKAGASSF